MSTNSKDRLEALLEEWTTEMRWFSAFKAQDALAGDPLPCDVCCRLEDQENPEILKALARRKKVLHITLNGFNRPERLILQLSERRRILAEYAEIRELLKREAPFLLNKLPMLEKRCMTNTDACLVKHAWQIKSVLKHLRDNKEMERRELVNAKDLATYFGKTINGMRMKLGRIRKRIPGCYIDRPEQGEQRTRTDCFLYRTAIILAELKK